MSEKRVVIGVDIGGTNTKYGIVDREGACLASSSMPTDSHHPAEQFFGRLYENSVRLLRDLKETCKLVGMGIGAPNANFYKGTIENPPNLDWDFVDIRKEMSRYVDLPLAVTNDAKAAALGEMFFGAARGMKDFIVITLGTGLGTGVVANGQLVYGLDSVAGEIGHTTVYENGRVCKCGRRGCLETYASATGLCRTVCELFCDTMTESELRNVSFREMTAERVHEAAIKGDSVALEAFEYTGRILGMKLADSVAHLGPEAIILSGGLAAAGELVVRPTRQSLEKHLFPVYRNRVQVLLTSLAEENPAVLGAGALIWSVLENR